MLLLSLATQAQRDFSWKDEYPGGVRDWSEYITPSAKSMGPNALPPPRLHDGRIGEYAEIEGGYGFYGHKGGKAPTHQASVRLFYPIVKERVAIELTVIPVEIFRYSDALADQMHTFSTSGTAQGDLYINTYVQLLKERKRFPDVTLRYGLRTASGSNANEARHTNAPGYYFDLAFGKDFALKDNQNLRLYGLTGFYVWQVWQVLAEEPVFQNDAAMYGLGAAYRYKNRIVRWHISGYCGYLNNGDRPMLSRAEIDVPIKGKAKLRFLYENGINDYPYHGYHLKFVYTFKPLHQRHYIIKDKSAAIY